jgi:hypothetical protein
VLDDGAQTISLTAKSPRRMITPQALKKMLRLREETGLAGEEWVATYEIGYLTAKGRHDLAGRVQRESAVNVASGYDVLSYALDSSEKYIEVKTTALEKRDFVITANELRVAEMLGQSYWIYFVSSIFSEDPQLVTINDPYSKIGASIHITPLAYRAQLQVGSGKMNVAALGPFPD